MTLAVNTIDNICYNTKQREKLSEEYFKLKKEYDTKLEKGMDIEDDGEYQKYLDDLEENFRPKLDRQWLRCFAAQFPKTRNAWFAKVVNGYKLDTIHRISEKQYNIFTMYATGEDRDAWKTFEKYCRCGDYFVTVRWKNNDRSITIQSLK